MAHQASGHPAGTPAWERSDAAQHDQIGTLTLGKTHQIPLRLAALARDRQPDAVDRAELARGVDEGLAQRGAVDTREFGGHERAELTGVGNVLPGAGLGDEVEHRDAPRTRVSDRPGKSSPGPLRPVDDDERAGSPSDRRQCDVRLRVQHHDNVNHEARRRVTNDAAAVAGVAEQD